jgi:hypothetical protein
MSIRNQQQFPSQAARGSRLTFEQRCVRWAEKHPRLAIAAFWQIGVIWTGLAPWTLMRATPEGHIDWYRFCWGWRIGRLLFTTGTQTLALRHASS